MSGIKPRAVMIGAAAALMLTCLAYLVLPTGPESYVPGRRVLGIAPYWPTAALAVVVFAHLAGGFVAGRRVPSTAGLNGALSAVLLPVALIGGYVAFSMAIDFQHINSVAEIRDLLSDEEAGGLVFLALALSVYLPLACLAGYVGGRLGGRQAPAREASG